MRWGNAGPGHWLASTRELPRLTLNRRAVWHVCGTGGATQAYAVQRTPAPLIIPSGLLGSSWVDGRWDDQIYFNHPRALARVLVLVIIPEPECPRRERSVFPSLWVYWRRWRGFRREVFLRPFEAMPPMS